MIGKQKGTGMKTEANIKKNFIYNTIYQLFTLITPFITAPYTARILGAEGIGLQSFVGSISSYFVLFAALGTAAYGQREIARCKDTPEERTKTFWEIILVKAVMTGIALTVWLVVIICSKEYKTYYIVSTITIAASFFDISWFFAGNEDFKTIVIRNLIIRIIGIVCLFTFIKSVEDLALYIAILALSTFLGNLSMWLGLRRYLCKVKIYDFELQHHFKETLVYFVPTISVSVYTILDKIMLGLLTDGTYENGYYEQAHKLVDMTKSIVISLNTVMYSRMSYLFKKGQTNEIRERLNQSIDVIFLLSMPMIMGVVGIAKTLVPCFFGEGYDKVVDLLYLCMPLVLVIGLSNCLGQQYLTPSGQRRKSNKAVIIGAFVNFGLNSLLIPKFGSYGAATASLIAEIVILVIYIKMSVAQLKTRFLIMNNLKRVFAAVVMFIIVQAMNQMPIHEISRLVCQIVVGAVSYGGLLIFTRDQLVNDVLKEAMAKRKEA